MIRPADTGDVEALVRIEERAFATDRFSRRAFRYLLSRANATTLVEADAGGQVQGYVMVLFNRGTSLARLYSIAVDPQVHHRGIGSALLQAGETAALEHDTAYMRLEVRASADASLRFYRRHGYRPFAVQRHYYEDDADAVRMQKRLVQPPDQVFARVDYYAQSLDFTCGPAAVLMAMHALDPSITVDQNAELHLWRESTTIFMTSGLGGCSPEGLALAVKRRGFAVDLVLSDEAVMFVDSVRNPDKRVVIRLVQEDFRRQLAASQVRLRFAPVVIGDLRERFEAGCIPVVLISSYRFDREKQPHWVVITGFDQKYVYLHDPNVDADHDKTATDCMHIPVSQRDFVKMARYGKTQQQAAIIVGREPG